MASANQDEKNHFDFIWVLKNADLCWHQQKERIESASFIVEEMEKTRWKLWLYPRGISTENVALFLTREGDMTGSELVEIEYELAFLDPDFKVMKSNGKLKEKFQKGLDATENPTVKQWNEFDCKMLEFVSNEAVTIRCRIWKCFGEFSDNMKYLSCCRIVEEKIFTMWRIENFSSLDEGKKYTHEIKSTRTGETSVTLNLLHDKINSDVFECDITPMKQSIKSCVINLMPLPTSGQLCFSVTGFYAFNVPETTQKFVNSSVRKNLMEEKHLFLPNDVLSLICVCRFCFGVLTEEDISSSEINLWKILPENNFVSSDNPFSLCLSGLNVHRNELDVIQNPTYDSIGFISDDNEHYQNIICHFSSMLLDHIHSDINLRVGVALYPAHKCILSARSSVFKAMLSAGNIGNFIDIKDFQGSTVSNMLIYIYSGSIEFDYEWSDAMELYMATATYKLQALKDICSSYLKKHLSMDNAFETLMVAMQFNDEDLEAFIRAFTSKRPRSWKNRLVQKFSKVFRRGSVTTASDTEFRISEDQLLAVENSVKQDFNYMLECGIHSDIKLKTSHALYSAHKCVLSARSPVFKTWISSLSGDMVGLEIEDLDHDTVSGLLRYIYSGKVGDLGWKKVLGLFVAANRYEFPDLKDECNSYLTEYMCKSKVRETLEFLHQHPDRDIQYFVMHYVKQNIEDYQPHECTQFLSDIVKIEKAYPNTDLYPEWWQNFLSSYGNG